MGVEWWGGNFGRWDLLSAFLLVCKSKHATCPDRQETSCRKSENLSLRLCEVFFGSVGVSFSSCKETRIRFYDD